MQDLEQDAPFAAALAECCERVRRGESLAACLADYPPAYRATLARLAPLAGQLGQLRHDPAPAFQARLEQRLLAEVVAARARRRPTWWQRAVRPFPGLRPARLAGIALAVVLMLGGGVGAVAASEDSLPDSPLYQVKSAREAVRLWLTRSGEGRVEVRADQIRRRGRELELAVRRGKRPLIVAPIARRFADEVDRMVDQALELRARGNPLAAARARALIQTMDAHVDRLMMQAPPESRAALRRLADFLAAQEARLR